MDTTVFYLFLIGLVIALIYFQYQRYHRLIEDKIDDIGGQLISYQRRFGFIGIGPYKFVGKGRTVYSIDYQLDGQIKEAWVKFGTFGGPDWRF